MSEETYNLTEDDIMGICCDLESKGLDMMDGDEKREIVQSCLARYVRKPKATCAAPALVRPSSLPKLACCRAYVGTAGTSEAAERGTKLDAAIRQAWMTLHTLNPDPQTRRLFPGLSTEDDQACNWAISRMIELAGEAHLETDEANLQAVVPVEGVQPGTMDGLCVERGFLIDYKTGQIRDYRAQMAAYALACMETYFADTWTAHLLFIDQEQVVTHHFTADEARELVESIVNAPIVAASCDYCGWCGAYGTCPITREQAAHVQEMGAALPAPTPAAKSAKTLPPALEEIVNDERRAFQFLKCLNVAGDWGDIIKRKIKDRLKASGERKTDFFQLIDMAGRQVVNPSDLAPFVQDIGMERLLAVCSQIPLAKVQVLWKEAFGEKPMPASLVMSAAGSSQLRLRKVDSRILTDSPEK